MDEARDLAERLRPSVGDQRVLDAIAAVPRHHFVPDPLRDRAYEDVALPIGGGQTISQPTVVARMLELLELTGAERVLDVGTGSGYHAALLGVLADEVASIEIDPELSAAAAARLIGLGYANVSCTVADGRRGLPERAPFHAINVAAARHRVPRQLLGQLRIGGLMVAPTGTDRQHLTRFARTPSGIRRRRLEAVRFVPLTDGPRG